MTRDPAKQDAAEVPSPRYQEALERFVLFWGEMASNWGINRTMAQIHALLYASDEPLDTDTIMARLKISRGNANMNLRSLMSWNLVRKVHRPGSRKDFFTAEKDVWQITARIIEERKRREIQPVQEQLRACRDLLTGSPGADCAALGPQERQFCERIDRLMELMDVFEGFSRALLPFIRAQNAPMIKQFIEIAETLHDDADGDA
ncbi:MAG: hypothetical protein KatS3mg042_1332 [Rhodothermaceae bacterium]|nr:MAG: hypothetical protein KatS3mg042_1332 [Rhodothermaceae bacterium]